MEIRDGTADAFQIVWEVFGEAVAASSAKIAIKYWEGPAGVAIVVSPTNPKARPVTVIADQLPQIQVWVGPDAPDLDHEL